MAAQIQQAKNRLVEVQSELAGIEKQRSVLLRERDSLQAKIAAWEDESADAVDPEQQAIAAARAEKLEEKNPSPFVAHTVEAAEDPAEAEERRKKQMKALNKKLQQIAKLKEKEAAGDTLDPEAQAKVDSEAKILKKVEMLKQGQDPESSGDEDPQPGAKPKNTRLPTDPEAREKRVKLLKKKVAQIANLKEKDPATLDEDAKGKLASERWWNQEIAALESGASKVEFLDPTDQEQQQEALDAKIEVEKQIKAIKKKLSGIEGLKKKENLEGDAQAKVNSEPALRKELHELEKQLGQMNQAERERVAKKLGFEEEAKRNMEESKSKKKGGKK